MNLRDSQIAGESEVDAKESVKGVLLTGVQPAPTGALQALYMPGPNSMARPYFVDFTTEGRDAVAISTGGQFQALRFVKPVEKIVHATDLPAEIQCSSGKLIIKRFNRDSFAIEEQGTTGEEVRVEIYYESPPPSVIPANSPFGTSGSTEAVPPIHRASDDSGDDLWDAFICHASEDKEIVARPIADSLRQMGLKVWFDELTLTIGDSLRSSIDLGLAKSRYGVVILSPSFFSKEWPQRELDGLVAKEVELGKVILPVWHEVTREDVMARSPTLADRLAVSTEKGLDIVVQEILKAARLGLVAGSDTDYPDYSAVPEADTPQGLLVEKVTQTVTDLETTWGLLIRNPGTDIAENCSGQLEELEMAAAGTGQTFQRYLQHYNLLWEQNPEDSPYTRIPGQQFGTLRIAHFIPRHREGRKLTLGYVGKQR